MFWDVSRDGVIYSGRATPHIFIFSIMARCAEFEKLPAAWKWACNDNTCTQIHALNSHNKNRIFSCTIWNPSNVSSWSHRHKTGRKADKNMPEAYSSARKNCLNWKEGLMLYIFRTTMENVQKNPQKRRILICILTKQPNTKIPISSN